MFFKSVSSRDALRDLLRPSCVGYQPGNAKSHLSQTDWPTVNERIHKPLVRLPRRIINETSQSSELLLDREPGLNEGSCEVGHLRRTALYADLLWRDRTAVTDTR